jgi:hypothetical protein
VPDANVGWLLGPPAWLLTTIFGPNVSVLYPAAAAAAGTGADDAEVVVQLPPLELVPEPELEPATVPLLEPDELPVLEPELEPAAVPELEPQPLLELPATVPPELEFVVLPELEPLPDDEPPLLDELDAVVPELEPLLVVPPDELLLDVHWELPSSGMIGVPPPLMLFGP